MCVSFQVPGYHLLIRTAYLRLKGIHAKVHPVFRELIRVKQYFEKIMTVRSDGPSKRSATVDKATVQRFIKHALTAKKPYDVIQEKHNQEIDPGTHVSFKSSPNKHIINGARSIASASQSSSMSSTDSERMIPSTTTLGSTTELFNADSQKKRPRHVGVNEKYCERQTNDKTKPRTNGETLWC